MFFYLIPICAQDNQWYSDLDALKHAFLQQKQLFKQVNRKQFIKRLSHIKQSKLQGKKFHFWQLANLLHEMGNVELKIQPIPSDCYPFEVKMFNSKVYITAIHSDYEKYLGHQLIQLNDTKVEGILLKTNLLETINIKSFLEFHQFSKSDTITLVLFSENKKEIIKMSYNESKNDLIKIIPKKTPFYLQKANRWFWKYGINFGQQVYFKYNIGLSNEFLTELMDSLQTSEITLARQYQLPLQYIYDAPKFESFTNNLFEKFENKRYKKLIIDVRNLKTGNSLVLTNFIKQLKRTKRINKNNRLFVLINKNLSASAIEMVQFLKKETRVTIVGAALNGLSCSTDKIKKHYLQYSNFTIFYPTEKCKKTTITPDIESTTSISHFSNGIDPVLQKVIAE